MFLFFRTYIKEIEGFEYIRENEKKGGKIAFAFWHGEQFFLIPFFSRKNIGIMVSLSRDGERQARFLSSLGYHPIRGSSSKGAISALIELIKYARNGNWTGFALDGPRGPIHQPKPGIIKLAYKTDAKIIPLRVFSSKKWVLSKAWDKYFIPKPFSKVKLSIRKPLELTGNEEIDLKSLKEALE
ncbi:MAG: lysophospholipid acyltransferase family protein [Thermoanaerobaculia bacterium]